MIFPEMESGATQIDNLRRGLLTVGAIYCYARGTTGYKYLRDEQSNKYKDLLFVGG